MHYAIEYPQRVTGLILVDPDPASKALWSRYADTIQGKLTQAEAEEISAIQASNGWNANPDLVARYFELALRPFFAACAVPPGFGHRFVGVRPENLSTTAAVVRNNLGDWDLHTLLPGIGCPALLVCGETSIFPEEAIAKLHEGIRNSTLVRTGGASHFPSIEAPGAFGRAAGSFLGVEPERAGQFGR
jgi:pimeloyl-ACP methyl ester carboxylesterase